MPKGSPITSVSQLKGKKIAYGTGSRANYQLLTVLNAAGLTSKQVSLVSLQQAEALAAFTSGSVDAWDIWPPYVQQVVAQDGAKILAEGSQYGSPYSFEVASKSAVANPEKAAAIQVYLTTLDKAYIFSRRNPNTWGAAWAAGGPPGQHHGRGGQGRLHRSGADRRARSRRRCRAWSRSSTGRPDPERRKHDQLRHDPVQLKRRQLTSHQRGSRPWPRCVRGQGVRGVPVRRPVRAGLIRSRFLRSGPPARGRSACAVGHFPFCIQDQILAF